MNGVKLAYLLIAYNRACGNYAGIILGILNEFLIADTILELFCNNLGIIRTIWE